MHGRTICGREHTIGMEMKESANLSHRSMTLLDTGLGASPTSTDSLIKYWTKKRVSLPVVTTTDIDLNRSNGSSYGT